MVALDRIHPGMRVLDASGAEIGTVDDLKMGDRGASTAEGQASPDADGLFEDLVHGLVGDGPDVSEQQRERMLRLGYIKVDRSGLLAGALYVAGDDVADVRGDAVHLTFTPE